MEKFRNKNINFINSLRWVTILGFGLHFLFVILFYKLNIKELMFFNIFSASLYIYLFFYRMKKHFVQSSMMLFLEVTSHVILCIYLLGWSGGFYAYILCLIPIVYFLAVNILKKDYLGHIFAGFIVFLYLSGKVFSQYRIAPYEYLFENTILNEIMYTLNTFSGGIILIMLLYPILYELRYIQINLEKKTETFKDMSQIDSLTQIGNRRYIDGILNKVDQYENVCIAFGDIDDFKKINDIYGHDIGDYTLTQLGILFKKQTEKFDLKVGRWGGEEFIIIFENYNIIEAKKICENLLEKIRNLKIYSGSKEVRITMTFGCAEFDKNNDIATTLKEADQNLYKGKKNGKNCVV